MAEAQRFSFVQSAIERQITNQRGSSTDPHLQFDDTEQHWRAAMESQPDPSQRHVSDEGGIYFSLRVRVCAKQLQPVPSDNLLMLHHETPLLRGHAISLCQNMECVPCKRLQATSHPQQPLNSCLVVV